MHYFTPREALLFLIREALFFHIREVGGVIFITSKGVVLSKEGRSVKNRIFQKLDM